MAIVGLIPFVYAVIKKKRRSTRTSCYERVASGAAARGREHAHFKGGGGGYQSQSCRFAVRPSPADELGVSYGDGPVGRPLPEGFSSERFSADRYERHATCGAARGRELEHAHVTSGGAGSYQSQSCRFAVRPSTAHELGVSYDDGSTPRPPPEDLPLLPPSRNDRLATSAALGREHANFNGGAYQSQSCRFSVRLSPADELGFSHDDGAARTPPPEDLSGKLLLPAGRNERGLSKSLRFSSMRVFAWVSGA